MGTKNGTAYLDAQLVSLATQAHGRIDIWVSDDGSTDETLTILKQWRGRWTKGRFEVLDGPWLLAPAFVRYRLGDPAARAGR